MAIRTQLETPAELARFVQDRDQSGCWFTYDVQDKLIFDIGLRLFFEGTDRSEDAYWNCLEKAKSYLKTYYNHRYNKQTRTGR